MPMAVRLQNNKIMLLWCASEHERSIWAKGFRDMMPPVPSNGEKPVVPKQLVNDENEFVATLYKCLVPAFGPDGTALPFGTDYRIRILQSGLLMKTSQKWGSFMDSKYYHLRFYELNIATGLFQAYTSDSDGKERS